MGTVVVPNTNAVQALIQQLYSYVIYLNSFSVPYIDFSSVQSFVAWVSYMVPAPFRAVAIIYAVVYFYRVILVNVLHIKNVVKWW